MLMTSTGGIIMSGEILGQKPVTVPLCQKARIWNGTEHMPPRTEVDFSRFFLVAPDKCGGGGGGGGCHIFSERVLCRSSYSYFFILSFN